MVKIIHGADELARQMQRGREARQHARFVGDQTRNHPDLRRLGIRRQRQPVAVVNVAARRNVPVHNQKIAILQIGQDRLLVPGHLPLAALILQQHARRTGDVAHQDGMQRRLELDRCIGRCNVDR